MWPDYDILDQIVRLLARLNPLNGVSPLIDIAIVTGMCYWIFKSISGTRAIQLLLESLGQTYQQFNFKRSADESGRLQMIKTVARSTTLLSQQGIGALIVIERNVGLQEYADRGVLIDARTSTPLPMAIFHPNAPLHDMAVLIRGERILAANVVLPLSEEMGGARRYGTRHRAARGISEQSDAVVVVVSEETGVITMFHDGQMISQLNEERVATLLVELLRVDTPTVEVAA